MHHDYADIRSKIPEDPKWFDEHSVPRYCDFSPSEVADIYAREACLALIACQNCGHKFKAAYAWSDFDKLADRPALSVIVPSKRLWRGDPPNINCCPAGPTMTSDDLEVLEFWTRDMNKFRKWTRVPELEISLCEPEK